jgi:UDP-2,3-diacylglucosamine hydrolase
MTAGAAMRQDGPLALICGGGSLPLTVADAAAAKGRKVVLFLLRGVADPALAARYPHHWIYVGQGGKLRALVRPALWQMRFDLWLLLKVPTLVKAFRGGDDHLLSGVARIFEREGFHLVGAHEVAPDILMPEGALGARQPSERDREDIALGLDYLAATGRFDIGQAVVVAGRRVLAVEAVEGTDQMLQRVANMRSNGRLRTPAGTGVLVKAPKPGQDRRFDLPAIGPRTVEGVVRAGLAGLAVAAGSSIVAEPETLVAEADRAKVFVVGVPIPAQG